MKRRAGFTLVELLVVIAIIGLLLQMLLPAVQMAREAARRTQCTNNLRQIGLAFQLHEQSQKHLPTGGWGWGWMGDPDRGFGSKQPGGWAFNLLPYVEQRALRNLSKESQGEARKESNRRLVATPLKVFTCPSRRLARAYPYVMGVNFLFLGIPERCARSDYAANLGAVADPVSSHGPISYEAAELWKVGEDPGANWTAANLDGIVFQRSRVELRQITDGLSKTLIVAEKYIPKASYRSGNSNGDNEHLYMGYDNDLLRSTHATRQPLRDSETDFTWRFGSSHPGAFQIALCDGSIHSLEYEIDTKVFEAYGTRNGEEIGGR